MVEWRGQKPSCGRKTVDRKYLERLIRIMGTFDLATGHADTLDELLNSLESELRDVLGHYREALKIKEEWVGLTDDEINSIEFPESGTATMRDFVRIIEAKLMERNK